MLTCEHGHAELRVHFEPSLWKEYEDTAQEHPQSGVIRSIVKVYKEIGSNTLVMPARSVHNNLTNFCICHVERL